MANILNIDAETNANLIGDDANPALSVENSSSGAALKLENSSTVGANATTQVPLQLVATGTASAAVLKITGTHGLVSASTINIGAAADSTLYGLRVIFPNGELGWIPVLDDAALTAVAV